MMDRQPLITLGSPIGVGYEIFLLSLAGDSYFKEHCVYCIGSVSIMTHFIKLLEVEYNYYRVEYSDFHNGGKLDSVNLQDYDFVIVDIDSLLNDGNIECDLLLSIGDIREFDEKCDGMIAYYTIVKGAALVEQGHFSALVTLPVSKKNINLVDPDFKGHTEFLMKLWKQEQVFMTFVSNKMKLLLLTTHIPLAEVPEHLTVNLVEQGLRTAGELAARLGEKRQICLLGLNPHAGEDGLLGREEQMMKEVVHRLRDEEGFDISEPIPADTAFTPFNIDRFGLFVSCYHDQGLIPFKMLSFEDGVNLSFGMNYIRTSVDHGTAVGLIGKKSASIESFVNAYRLAQQLTG